MYHCISSVPYRLECAVRRCWNVRYGWKRKSVCQTHQLIGQKIKAVPPVAQQQNSQLQILRLRVQIPPLALSHCDISLLLIRIQFTRTDLCIYTPLWRQNYFESLSVERWLLPPYFWIRFFESRSTLRFYYLSITYWCE